MCSTSWGSSVVKVGKVGSRYKCGFSNNIQRLKQRIACWIDDLIFFVMLNGRTSVVENIHFEKCEQGIKVNC